MPKNPSVYNDKVSYQDRYRYETEIGKWRRKEVTSLLLDNSLITQTKKGRVDIKLIDCGSYKQLYCFKKCYVREDSNLEKFRSFSLTSMRDYDTEFYYAEKKEKNKKETKNELKKIEIKNLNRSRFEMQRLVKTNETEFKTFITLTFEENILDLKKANKSFNSFRTYIKKLKPDFKYIGVPEFQERGAVHYHLLTNIAYDDFNVLNEKVIKLWSPSDNKWQIGRNINGWNKGYSLVIDLKEIDNIVGYISKYMTKDIDNRLWGMRRYYYSQNLKKPSITYLDLTNPGDFKIYLDCTTGNYIKNYETEYTDFNGKEVLYQEFQYK